MSFIPRSIAVIQQQIIDQKNSYAELNSWSSVSKVAKWRLWTFIQAVSISFLEQIIQVFSVNIENEMINRTVGTKAWIYYNSFLFQYDLTVPQIISVDPATFKISYPIIDVTKQLITRCAVSTQSNGLVNVKVAKQNPPTSLDNNEISAFQSYLNDIMPCIQTQAISVLPDQIRIEADIYYTGQYSSIINTSVKNAINSYFAGVTFGGDIVISVLEESLLNVPGVNDINIKRITARPDSVYFNVLTNSQIYANGYGSLDVNNRKYTPYAGYIIPETTTGNTLDDTLNFYIS